ncbi:hypothetical protein B0H13DRAFT_2374006 [Mycena leptocephala]|nr:hypothetical protein B0H13DRAFT_2374006 [Mycena leptocephala]
MVGQDLHDLIDAAPTIRELHFLERTNLTSNSLPTSLTSLELGAFISIEAMFEVLTKLPLLAHLKCRLAWLATRRSTTPTIFPRLRALSLEEQEFTTAELALDFLTLPNLRTLALSAYVDLDVLLAFIERSSCELYDIRLDLTTYTDFELNLCSPALRSAHRIEIMSDDPNVVFQWINWAPHMAFPFLTELVVVGYEPKFDYAVLIILLRSRRGTGQPVQLQSCRLEFYNGAHIIWQPQGVIAEELRKLMNEGLKFTIHVDYPEACWP